MLGLSLSKILFTVMLIVAVWQTYRKLAPWIARLQERDQPAPSRPAAAKPSRPADARSVELVACPHCGTFVPRGQLCASRDDCRVRHG